MPASTLTNPVPISNEQTPKKPLYIGERQNTIASELVIVVVGIFVAIQADRWWQQQDDLQQEQLYIARLTNDVGHDISAIEYAVSLATYRLSLSSLLIEGIRTREGRSIGTGGIRA